MVVKRSSTSDISGNDEKNNLSEYEKLRLQKMRRNEARMKELGLLETKNATSSLQKKARGKKEKLAPQLPQRRSSRKRKTVANYNEEQVIPMHSDEEQFDEADSEGDSDDGTDDENEDSYEMPPPDDENRDNDSDSDSYEEEELFVAERPTKKRKQTDPKSKSKPSKAPSTTATTDAAPTFECVNPKGGLTLEYAKTGRSKCRKCGQKIEKDKPRVGMEAWIVGRNCITWQCPRCLLQNLCCVYEKSNGGRGRCKVTNRPFAKGQLKIGIRCHTATSYYHVRSVAGVLNNVVDLMATDKDNDNDSDSDGNAGDYELTVESISGNEKLSDQDRETLESVLKTVSSNWEGTGAGATKGSPKQDSTSENGIAEDNESSETESSNAKKKVSKEKEQPKAGSKTGATGKVEWKFGGRTCYGTLLPSKETKTHCYARTHKGNIKTLAKGKDYWSVIG